MNWEGRNGLGGDRSADFVFRRKLFWGAPEVFMGCKIWWFYLDFCALKSKMCRGRKIFERDGAWKGARLDFKGLEWLEHFEIKENSGRKCGPREGFQPLPPEGRAQIMAHRHIYIYIYIDRER